MEHGPRLAVSRLLVGVLATCLVVLAPGAAPVSAHTDFDFSIPAQDEVVGAPVDEITIAFTLPVTLVGNGFEVRTPQGDVLEPQAVTSDDTVYVLAFDEPLAGGLVAVRWEVAAADGHPLSGAFTFQVDALTVADELPATTAAPAESVMTSPPAEPEADAPPVESAQTTEPNPAPTAQTSNPSAGTSTDRSGDGSEGGSNTDLFLAALASLVMGVGAFTVLRPTAGA